MSAGWHALLGALTLIAILGAVGSLVAWIVAQGIGRTRWSAGWKSTTLLVCLALPLLSVTSLLIASFLPSLLDLLGIVPDNCSPDHTHHPHLCPLHPSAPVEGPALWLCVVGFVWMGNVVMAGIRAGMRIVQTCFNSPIDAPMDSPTKASVCIELDALSEEQRQALDAATVGLPIGVQVIRSPVPVAALVGIVRPRVILSTTLLELLPPDELLAVVQHEAAHHTRRDLLTEACIELLAACHMPMIGKVLKTAYRDVVELACDERAAAHLGSGLPGASALLRLHRWALTARQGLQLPSGVPEGVSPGMSIGWATAGASQGAAQRIQSLIQWSGSPPGPTSLSPFVWLPVGVAVGLILVAREPIHHLLEDLLGMLSG